MPEPMSWVSPKNERTSSRVMVGVNSLTCSDVTCVGLCIGSPLSGSRFRISSVSRLLSPELHNQIAASQLI